MMTRRPPQAWPARCVCTCCRHKARLQPAAIHPHIHTMTAALPHSFPVPVVLAPWPQLPPAPPTSQLPAPPALFVRSRPCYPSLLLAPPAHPPHTHPHTHTPTCAVSAASAARRRSTSPSATPSCRRSTATCPGPGGAAAAALLLLLAPPADATSAPDRPSRAAATSGL